MARTITHIFMLEYVYAFVCYAFHDEEILIAPLSVLLQRFIITETETYERGDRHNKRLKRRQTIECVLCVRKCY